MDLINGSKQNALDSTYSSQLLTSKELSFSDSNSNSGQLIPSSVLNKNSSSRQVSIYNPNKNGWKQLDEAAERALEEFMRSPRSNIRKSVVGNNGSQTGR